MAYTPTRQIIRHGTAGVTFPGAESNAEGWNQLVTEHFSRQKERYQETLDLYDMQREQAQSFDSLLEGLEGKDYEYQQQRIIEARNRLAELYKGKSLLETKTPEFQSQVHQIASGLGKVRNSIGTSLSDIKKAKEISEKNPSYIRAEVDKYLAEQAKLPPDQRDPDILARVTSDPLFFNAFDYASNVMDQFDTKTFSKDRYTKHEIQHWEYKYHPDLGAYNKKGEFQWNISDAVVDAHLQDPRFYKKMEGMIPSNLAASLRAEGNDSELRKAVRNQAKEFLKGIKSLQPDGSLKSSRAIPQPTAGDRKVEEQNSEVEYVMKKLLSGDANILNTAFKSSDTWDGFELQMTGGKVTGVRAYLKEKTPTGRVKRKETPEFFPIDPNDPFGSTQFLLNALKFQSQGDKEKVSFIPKEGGAPVPAPTRGAGRFN